MMKHFFLSEIHFRVHVHLSTLCDGLLSNESLRDLFAELVA